ncbi:MAG TPA: hypothetical protein VIV11_29685 [Kofleriaceae bacterium]
MKNWWLALVALAGCVSTESELDATGTFSTQLTYGGGNCFKTGSEQFTIFVAKNGYGGYDMTQSAVGQTINGNVFCGSDSCDVMFFKSWQNNNDESLHLDGTLVLDGDTNQITGNGKYSVFGLGVDCDQTVTFAGTRQ